MNEHFGNQRCSFFFNQHLPPLFYKKVFVFLFQILLYFSLYELAFKGNVTHLVAFLYRNREYSAYFLSILLVLYLILRSPHLILYPTDLILHPTDLILCSPHLILRSPHLILYSPHLILRSPHLILYSTEFIFYYSYHKLEKIQHSF